MKFAQLAILLIIVATGCKKAHKGAPPIHPKHPPMEYIDLNGREASFNVAQHIDLDGNGSRDFSFVTYHIGDPVLKRDIIEFSATSTVDRLLLVNNEDDSPIFNRGDRIGKNVAPGYNWFDVSAVPLSKKIIENQKAPYWIGKWNNALHKYLAIQVQKNGALYNGWFEISMDTASEKIIIYKAAISKEPQVNVRAGY